MNKKSYVNYYFLAEENIKKKRYEEAKENLLNSLDLKKSFKSLNLLGIIYLHLMEYEKSIKIPQLTADFPPPHEIITEEKKSNGDFKRYIVWEWVENL